MAGIVICYAMKRFCFYFFFYIGIFIKPFGCCKKFSFYFFMPFNHFRHMIFNIFFIIFFQHCKTGCFRNKNSIDIVNKRFEIFYVFFDKIFGCFKIAGKICRCPAAVLLFGNKNIYIQKFQNFNESIPNLCIIVIGKTSYKDSNSFFRYFSRNFFRIFLQKRFLSKSRNKPSFVKQRK